MRWRIRAVAGEAARNFSVTPMRRLMLVGMFASMFGSLALAELVFSDDLIAFSRQYERSGGYVVVAKAEAGLDASRCERLTDHPVVVAAGGASVVERTRLAALPGVSMTTAEITQGLLYVWDPVLRSADAGPISGAVGSALADELAIAAGNLIQPEGSEPFRVDAVADTEARNPNATRTLLTVSAPTGLVSQCWAEFEPEAFDAAVGYMQTVFDDGSPEISDKLTAAPWIELDEFARDPVAELAGRPHRYGWVLVAGLSAVMTWLMIWFRRSELGLYRALGTSRPAMLLLVQAEILIVVMLALPIGMATATLVHAAGGAAPTIGQFVLAARSAAMAAATAALLAPLAALLVGRKALLSLLKDR